MLSTRAISVIHIEWNPVKTDTKGTRQNVRIIGVSVLSGFPYKKVTDTCFIDVNPKAGLFYGDNVLVVPVKIYFRKA